MSHVFISYSRQDTAIMQRIRDELRAAGIDVWTDENLTPGEKSWRDAIEVAIENAGALVVLMSPDSKRSEWVEKEISYATACNVPIFPVLLRGTELEAVPIDLINMQRVDIRQQADHAITTNLAPTLHALLGITPPPAKPTEAPARRRQSQPEPPQHRTSSLTYNPTRTQQPAMNELMSTFGFTAEALRLNRQGKLTEAQRMYVREQWKTNDRWSIMIAIVITIGLSYAVLWGGGDTTLGYIVLGIWVFSFLVAGLSIFSAPVNTLQGTITIARKSDNTFGLKVEDNWLHVTLSQFALKEREGQLPGKYKAYASRTHLLSIEPWDGNTNS